MPKSKWCWKCSSATRAILLESASRNRHVYQATFALHLAPLAGPPCSSATKPAFEAKPNDGHFLATTPPISIYLARKGLLMQNMSFHSFQPSCCAPSRSFGTSRQCQILPDMFASVVVIGDPSSNPSSAPPHQPHIQMYDKKGRVFYFACLHESFLRSTNQQKGPNNFLLSTEKPLEMR